MKMNEIIDKDTKQELKELTKDIKYHSSIILARIQAKGILDDTYDYSKEEIVKCIDRYKKLGGEIFKIHDMEYWGNDHIKRYNVIKDIPYYFGPNNKNATLFEEYGDPDFYCRKVGNIGTGEIDVQQFGKQGVLLINGNILQNVWYGIDKGKPVIRNYTPKYSPDIEIKISQQDFEKMVSEKYIKELTSAE